MIDKCSIVDIRSDLHKRMHFDKPENRQQEETIFTTTESAACVSPARQVNIKVRLTGCDGGRGNLHGCTHACA